MRRTMAVLGVTAVIGTLSACGGDGSPKADPNNVGSGGSGGGGGAPDVQLPDPPPEPVLGDQLDREGRDGVNLAVTDPWGLQELFSFQLRDVYNRASERELWPVLFRDRFEFSMGVWDGIDGNCGNQLAAGPNAAPGRYSTFATLLLDDVLMLDTSFATCHEFLAVEQRMLGVADPQDCGGRTPTMNAKDALMTFLARGPSGRNPDGTWQITDGILADQDGTPSLTDFPFLLPADIGTPGVSGGGIDPMQSYLTCVDLAEARCAMVYKCWTRDGIPDAYRDAYSWKEPECIRALTAECKGTSAANYGPKCPAGQSLDPVKIRGCERAYSMATCAAVEAAGAGMLPECGSMCM